MRLILIFGPQAVGKMTVGQELAKITDLKLFHNHMSIDLLLNFFEYGSPAFRRLNTLLRNELLEEVAKSELEGVIFTYVWAFDMQEDWNFVEYISNIFESKGREVYYVELEAEMNERLKRNVSPNRLEHKPTKRNLERSRQDLISTFEQHRLNSFEGEIQKKNYIKINNKDMSAGEVAAKIKETFRL